MDIICDIDGTLADCEHRRHFISTKPKNYKAFHAGAYLDPVIEPVAAVIRTLQRQYGNCVIFSSGRPESSRAMTQEWLVENRLWKHSCSAVSKLYLRADNDFRPDDVIKLEMLDQMLKEGFNPQMAFDDRARVVQAWRSRGLICAQVAEGNF